VVGAYEHLDGIDTRARAVLAASVAMRGHRYPGVAIEQVVARGNAAEVLVGMSRSAQLVVVGTRGHGGFPGLLLGSVGLRLIHHADCPVLLARTREPMRGTEPGAP